MSDVERNTILKVALLLVLLEGWAEAVVVRARLGVDVAPALIWLGQNGYVQMGMDAEGDAATARWRAQHTFESLWDRLMPQRPCPITLCGRGSRASQRRELRQ